jgi:hypothetical protein
LLTVQREIDCVGDGGARAFEIDHAGRLWCCGFNAPCGVLAMQANISSTTACLVLRV